MIHVYKAGGELKTPDGKAYSIKCINADDWPTYKADGWVETKAEALIVKRGPKPKSKDVESKEAE